MGIAIPHARAAGETGESRRVQEEEEGVHQGFVGDGCKCAWAQAVGAVPYVLEDGWGLGREGEDDFHSYDLC